MGKVSVTELRSGLYPLVVPVDELRINIIYRGGLLTNRFLDEYDSRPIEEFVVAIVESWDIVYEDGTPVPIEVDAISDVVPKRVCNLIYHEIYKDQLPGLRKQKSEPLPIPTIQ